MSIEEIEPKAAAVAIAPRVSAADIDASISKAAFVIYGGGLTLCIITMKNGFMVVGESAAASPENFNLRLGRDIALNRAKEKIWPLLGYALRDRLAGDKPFATDATYYKHKSIFGDFVEFMASPTWRDDVLDIDGRA